MLFNPENYPYSLNTKIVQMAFYLIQRGEAGHKRGCYTQEYADCGGVRTIGYGTVTEDGYNPLDYREKTITEEMAVSLAQQEMVYKLDEKCRTKFRNYDQLLPCYQAVILDTVYQGFWTRIVDDFNNGNMQAVYDTVTDTSLPKNGNKERAAVRGRAIEMGMQIEAVQQANPSADPRAVASLLAQQMIVKYQHLNGTDLELTRDELALLYRSTMFAYGVNCSEQEIRDFALSFPNVATGMHGIGSNGEQMTPGSSNMFSTYQNQAAYVVNSSRQGVNSLLAGAQSTDSVAQAEAQQNKGTNETENSTGAEIVNAVLSMVGMQALLKIVGNVLDVDSSSSSSNGVSAIASALLNGKSDNQA